MTPRLPQREGATGPRACTVTHTLGEHMSTSPDRSEPAGAIPPYGERDERAAREAVERLSDTYGLVELTRTIAGEVARARTEGYRDGALAAMNEHLRLETVSECGCSLCVLAELGIER
jgi:hypothetical protein